MRFALALLIATAGACLATPPYQCATSDQCTEGGTLGRCEPDGFCSLADSTCAGGYRWAGGAPMAGTCVGQVSGNVDVCLVQSKLDRASDSCVDDVCSQDSRCCDREWSEACVQRAETLCHHPCGTVVASIGYGTVRVQKWDGTKLAPLWSKQTFANQSTAAIAWGDYDGDHLPDLATCEGQTQTLPGKLCIWHNGGTCGEAFCQVKCVDVSDCSRVEWVDVDGDGDQDLADFHAYSSSLWINDQGLFGDTLYEPFGPDICADADWADVDGDGQLDVGIAGYGTPAGIAKVTKGGADYLTLAPIWDDSATDASTQHEEFKFRDVDLDGRIDAIASGSGMLKIWANTSPQADGFTASTTPYFDDSAFDAEGLVLLDVDEDGDPDLVVADGGGHVNVLRNNELPGGSDSFTMTPMWVSGGTYNGVRVRAGDVDGDGHIDLVVGSVGTTPPNALQVYLARGTLGMFGDSGDAPTWADPTVNNVCDLALTGAW